MKSIIFIFLIFGSFGLIAQTAPHTINDKNLSSQQIFRITQDDKGFIWFSDRFGISRYDGYQVKHYEVPLIANKSPARHVNVITNYEKQIFAYTSNGNLFAYNTNGDRFNLRKNLGVYIRTATVDQQGKVWFGSHDLVGSLQDTTVVRYRSPLLKNCLVKEIIDYSPQQKIIIADYAILWLNVSTGQMSYILSDILRNEIKGLQVETAHLEVDKDVLWLGTVGKGIWYYNIKSHQLRSRIPFKESTMVSSIHTMPDGSLLVGTDGDGVSIFANHSLELKYHLRTDGDDNQYLSGDAVYHVFRDKESRVWIATNGGITRIEKPLKGLHVTSKNNDLTGLLNHDFVTNLLEDSKGNLWLGSNAGLSFRKGKRGDAKEILASLYILCLYEDSDGFVWVGTFGSGVYQFDQRGTLIRHFSRTADPNKALSTNFIYGIEEDRMGNMWFAGKKGDASRFNKKTGVFTPVVLRQTNSLIKMENGNLLAATEFGLFEVNVSSAKVSGHEINSRLKSKYICDIYLEGDKALWLATYGAGLIRYDLKTKKQISILTDESSSQEIIFSIVSDADGKRLWLAGKDKISSLDFQTYEVKNYPKKLLSLDLNFLQGSRMRDNIGHIYFGGTKGLVQIVPDEMQRPAPSDKIVLLNFNLFNKTVEGGIPDSPLKAALDDVEEISLKHFQHSFGLSFTTINFSQAVERRFMWKLDGFDDEWVDPSTENMVNYTNLDPGDYKFRLRAVGNENEIIDERTVSIRIHPAFYKTTVAYLVYVLFISVIVYWLLKQVKIRSYLKSSLAFEKREKERTAEMATHKLNFFTEVSHEIRTPISLILGQVEQLMKSGKIHTQTQGKVQRIYRNALNLSSLVNELLDFRKQDEGQLSLFWEEVNLAEMVQDICTVFEDSAHQKKMSFTRSLPNDQTILLPLDRAQIRKVINNLLINAFKATSTGGCVNVLLENFEDHIILTVSDTGKGIPSNRIENLFRPFYQIEPHAEASTGIGLAITKKIVELHGGSITVESMEGKGSIFQVRLPKKNTEIVAQRASNTLNDQAPVMVQQNFIREETAPHDVVMSSSRPTILLIDDNVELLAFVQEILLPLFNVVVASDGVKGLAKAIKLQPDLIISDVMMPNMSGTTMCNNLKSNIDTSHIPVLLLTAKATIENQLEGLRVGADDYMIKPFHSELLIQRSNNLINNRNLVRKKFFKEPDYDVKELVGSSEIDRVFLDKATRIVEDRLETHIDVGILAQELGWSRSSLFTKLKGMTGLTPNAFIATIRLKKAASLLAQSSALNISQIAYTLGFSSPRYFNKCFKEQFGCSPQEYRKNHTK